MRRFGKALGSIFFILVLAGEVVAGGAMPPSTSPQTAPPVQQPKVTAPVRPAAPAPATPVQPGPRVVAPQQPRVAPPPALQTPTAPTPFNDMRFLIHARETQAIYDKHNRRLQQAQNDYQRRRELLWEQLRRVNNKEIDARNFKHYAQADAYQQEVIKLRNALSQLDRDYSLNNQRILQDRHRELDNLGIFQQYY